MSYVTEDLVKEYLGIPAADTTRANILAVVMDAVDAGIDTVTGGRTFTVPSSTSQVTLETAKATPHPDGELLLCPDIASETGLVVEVGSSRTSWTDITTDVDLWPVDALGKSEPATGLLYVSGYWPRGQGLRCRLTARIGWPAVPGGLTQAYLLACGRLWQRKDSPQGIVGSAEWGAIRVGRFDPDIDAILQPLRRARGFA